MNAAFFIVPHRRFRVLCTPKRGTPSQAKSLYRCLAVTHINPCTRHVHVVVIPSALIQRERYSDKSSEMAKVDILAAAAVSWHGSI